MVWISYGIKKSSEKGLETRKWKRMLQSPTLSSRKNCIPSIGSIGVCMERRARAFWPDHYPSVWRSFVFQLLKKVSFEIFRNIVIFHQLVSWSSFVVFVIKKINRIFILSRPIIIKIIIHFYPELFPRNRIQFVCLDEFISESSTQFFRGPRSISRPVFDDVSDNNRLLFLFVLL